MEHKYLYKCITIHPVSGEVTELFCHPGRKPTTLDALGADGWKLIGCEYLGTKAAQGGELKSASMWIAIKEV